MSNLIPANQNPWYVLMTLYGEQTAVFIDEALREKNRRAWNAWAGQALSVEAQETAAKSSMIDVAELRSWDELGPEITQRFQAQMKARGNSVENSHRLPDTQAIIELSNTVFANTVPCSNIVFSAETRFSGAKFCKSAGFNFATFSEETRFFSTEFLERAAFHGATFSAKAMFNSATFNEIADFAHAKFNAEADFDRATFDDEARFKSTIFSGVAWFSSATFSLAASFLSSTFSADAAFHSTRFSGFAYFMESKFGATKSKTECRVIFSESHFEKPVSFREAVFLENYPNFSGAILHDNVTFTAKPEYWPSTPKQSPEDAKDSCATIRHSLAKQGLPEEEHFFFRREMGYAGQIGSWWQRAPYRAFGLFSDYGYSIARPAFCLFGLWVISALIYLAAFAWNDVMACKDFRILEPFALSFANIFKFFGFQELHFAKFFESSPAFLDVLSGIQTVIGYVLLFFLGLGLRQRFRLR